MAIHAPRSHEKDRLLIHVAAELAEKRRARGLTLNYPEAVAILTSWVYEAARDGRTVVDLMEAGRHGVTQVVDATLGCHAEMGRAILA